MLGDLTNHLWQSTAWAAAAGLLTLTLRSNRARVRHWLWFAASIKFLIPLSLLISLGSRIEWQREPLPPTVTIAMDQIVEPFSVQSVLLPAQLETPPKLLFVMLFVLWAAGVFSLSCNWFLRWRRIRHVVRNGRPLPMDFPLRVVSSATTLEPGVFGILRPILLLPDGILDRLTPAQMNAVLAHELCHVRRRDNLLASIHMFVETIFWFHPLVWWIGKRMVAERERACDEEVLRTLGEPQVYAEGILGVCKLYTESPLRCVSGVTGADLKKRMIAIMENRTTLKLNVPKRAVLALAAIAAIVIPVAIGVNTSSVNAQSRPKFEVASIRFSKDCGIPPSPPPTGPAQFKGGGSPPPPSGSPAAGNPERISICSTVERLIPRAYVYAASGQDGPPQMIVPIPVEGGPDWIRSDPYQIDAKAEGAPGATMMSGPMMQVLLEDRFNLKIHRETRQIPAYVLTVSKSGKLTEVKGSCAPFGAPRPLAPGLAACGPQGLEQRGTNIRWGFVGTADQFSKILYTWTDRPVLDRTGLEGLYDFHIEFAPDATMPNYLLQKPEDPIGGTSVFTALQEQLGLKLDSTRGPREFLVVDSIERPSEN